MENFTPKKLELNDINSGKKFVNGDSPTADAFNKVIEGVLASENGGGTTDVQINGTSITKDGVANIPLANGTTQGVVYTPNGNWNGILISNGIPTLIEASKVQIDEKSTRLFAITPKNFDYALKVGITTNSEELTDGEKANACEWLGAVEKKESPDTNFRYVYGIGYGAGEETLIPVTDGAIPYRKIVMGDGMGRIVCWEPATDYQATNKIYVETNFVKKKYRHCITADISKDGGITAGGGGFCVEIIDDVNQAITNSANLLISHTGKFKASGGVKVNDTIMPIISIYCNGDSAGNYIAYIGADGYINQYSITDPDWIMNVTDNIYEF